MPARIFKPAKNAMQSGVAKTKVWQLDYEPELPRVVEPLMGWTSSSDMKQQLTLHFATREEAVHMLVLIEPLAKGRQPTWKVRCDCGVEKVTRAARLFGSRPLLSCGCYRKPRIGDPAAATRKPTYRIWANMKRRATNTDDPLYAGRGIGICDRWRHGENGKTGFECFLADMGDLPIATSLDRQNRQRW